MMENTCSLNGFESCAVKCVLEQAQAIEQLRADQRLNGRQPVRDISGCHRFWKTFMMANIIRQLNKPTLIIAYNKTLAVQFYGEFKEYFPNNVCRKNL